MKITAVLLTLAFAAPAFAQTQVDGYYRKDGTFVAPHMRSAPDTSRINNYSAENNPYGGNPFTGKKGSQRDELSPQPVFNEPRQQTPRNCTTDMFGRTNCY